MAMETWAQALSVEIQVITFKTNHLVVPSRVFATSSQLLMKFLGGTISNFLCHCGKNVLEIWMQN